ncbi:MAG: hypothetical protein AAFR21_07120, partial [Pseudomonadota bacterium]
RPYFCEGGRKKPIDEAFVIHIQKLSSIGPIQEDAMKNLKVSLHEIAQDSIGLANAVLADPIGQQVVAGLITAFVIFAFAKITRPRCNHPDHNGQ